MLKVVQALKLASLYFTKLLWSGTYKLSFVVIKWWKPLIIRIVSVSLAIPWNIV